MTLNRIATLENMQKGMYANKLIVHDAFNKTITEHNFDYNNFEKEYNADTNRYEALVRLVYHQLRRLVKRSENPRHYQTCT